MAMKTVAVIGAGVSGITSTKACLEQGMDVTCYEMHNDIGGIWYYTEHSRPDEGATVYDFLMTNTSREMMRFSDFHFPSSAPAFPRHREMHAYLHSYANKFGVTKHVQLETKVIALQKSAGHSSDGRWIVVTQRKGENKKETKEFDAVIVSCGFHRIPNIPEIEGFSNFKGEWSHSKTFKSAKPFTGKRVLVIGNANSALDTATGMADYAEKVYLSVGQGCWVVPRLTNRTTYDTFLLRRWHISYLGILDRKWRKVCEDYFNHREAGIRASSGPIHHFPTINDDIGSRIACGKIKVVPRTVQFLTNGVRLEDGTVLQDIDHVVFATGFQPDHNLLDLDTVTNSYKRVFPLNGEKPTLAFVGLLSTTGPLPPTAEMQARFASLVFAGKHKLPPKNEMAADINRWKGMQEFLFGKEKFWVVSLPLQDEIAQEIGVFPDFLKVFLKSPRIAFQTYFGPAFTAQYRILGEGKTDHAIEDCKQAWALTTEGIKLRNVPKLTHESMWPVYKTVLCYTVVVPIVCAVVAVLVAKYFNNY